MSAVLTYETPTDALHDAIADARIVRIALICGFAYAALQLVSQVLGFCVFYISTPRREWETSIKPYSSGVSFVAYLLLEIVMYDALRARISAGVARRWTIGVLILLIGSFGAWF